MTAADTRDTIMAVARKIVQVRGYNALSFRDLAKEVGIKSASIYYYFPTKGGLGAELAKRYADELMAYLNGVLADERDWKTCIDTYVDVFRTTMLDGNRMCLAGMLAAEGQDLLPEVRVEVARFNELNVEWLERVVALGKPEMEPKEVHRLALAILAAVEGAQLVARGWNGEVSIFDDVLKGFRAAGLFS